MYDISLVEVMTAMGTLAENRCVSLSWRFVAREQPCSHMDGLSTQGVRRFVPPGRSCAVGGKPRPRAGRACAGGGKPGKPRRQGL